MRLNQERQNKLEPTRMLAAKEALFQLDYDITFETDSELRFIFRDFEIKFFPYSGWHTGKTIQDGRGLQKLLRQIKRDE